MDWKMELALLIVAVCGTFLAVTIALNRTHRWFYYAVVAAISIAVIYQYRAGLYSVIRPFLP